MYYHTIYDNFILMGFFFFQFYNVHIDVKDFQYCNTYGAFIGVNLTMYVFIVFEFVKV